MDPQTRPGTSGHTYRKSPQLLRTRREGHWSLFYHSRRTARRETDKVTHDKWPRTSWRWCRSGPGGDSRGSVSTGRGSTPRTYSEDPRWSTSHTTGYSRTTSSLIGQGWDEGSRVERAARRIAKRRIRSTLHGSRKDSTSDDTPCTDKTPFCYCN